VFVAVQYNSTMPRLADMWCGKAMVFLKLVSQLDRAKEKCFELTAIFDNNSRNGGKAVTRGFFGPWQSHERD
jgi:hypothetical protein